MSQSPISTPRNLLINLPSEFNFFVLNHQYPKSATTNGGTKQEAGRFGGVQLPQHSQRVAWLHKRCVGHEGHAGEVLWV